jgi:hypothetical protein
MEDYGDQKFSEFETVMSSDIYSERTGRTLGSREDSVGITEEGEAQLLKNQPCKSERSAYIAADLIYDHLGLLHPDISYDPEEDVLALGEITDTDKVLYPQRLTEDLTEEAVDVDSFYETVAAHRELAGDPDVHGDILTHLEDDGSLGFVSVDLANAGLSASEVSGISRDGWMKDVGRRYGFEFDSGEVERHARKLAEDVNTDKLETEYRQLVNEGVIENKWFSIYGERSVQNILDNVREFSS